MWIAGVKVDGVDLRVLIPRGPFDTAVTNIVMTQRWSANGSELQAEALMRGKPEGLQDSKSE
jgi:hypothetical protein